jgi:hypothetical protein
MLPTILAMTLVLVSVAQSEPDFSGRWVLVAPDAAPVDVARVILVEQPVTRTNIRGEPMSPAFLRIVIRRERVSETTTDTRLIGVIGGVMGGAVTATGQRIPAPSTYLETRWRDNSLILVNRVDGPDGPHTGDWSERQETWSLDADGRLCVEIITAAQDHPRHTSTFLYRRG